MKKVRIITSQNKSSLVEWVDDKGVLNRAYVPSSKVSDTNHVEIDVLNAGIPHGLPFEDFLPAITVDPQTLTQNLHKNGIWTLDDMKNRPKEVAGCINAALGFGYYHLLKLAKENNN